MANTVEQRITRKVIKALKDAGTPVTSVWDGEEDTPVKTVDEIMALADNLDQFHLYTAEGAWVFIVNGEGWTALTDNTLSLEEALKPVDEWIGAHL